MKKMETEKKKRAVRPKMEILDTEDGHLSVAGKDTYQIRHELRNLGGDWKVKDSGKSWIFDTADKNPEELRNSIQEVIDNFYLGRLEIRKEAGKLAWETRRQRMLYEKNKDVIDQKINFLEDRIRRIGAYVWIPYQGFCLSCKSQVILDYEIDENNDHDYPTGCPRCCRSWDD